MSGAPLEEQIAELHRRLEEAQQTIRALMSGEVDAIVQEDASTPMLLRAAQQKMRASEQLLRAVFEGATDAMLLADDDGRYIDANPAACRVFGLPKEELVGRRIVDFGAPGSLPLAAWETFIGQGHLSGEFALLRPDGTRRELEYSAVAHVLQGVHLSVLRDVTDRKAADRSLNQTQERLRTIISNAPIILFAIDCEGTYTLHEGKGVELLGLEPGQLVGQSVFARQEERQGAAASIRRALAGETVTGEFDFGKKAFDCTLHPVRDEHGAPAGIIGVAVDVSARKKAEETLRTSEARFRGMIENGAEGILLIDRDGLILYSSEPAARILGCDVADLVGTSSIDLVLDEDRASMRRDSRAFLEHPSGTVLQEFRVRHPTRGIRWIESMGANLLADPSVRARVSNFRDVTDRKVAEAALRHSQQLLEEAQAVAHLGSWSSGAGLDAPILWSAECARIFGADVSAPPTPAGFLRMTHPDDRARIVAAHERAVVRGGPCETEHRILLPTGEIRWVFAKSVVEGSLRADAALLDDRDPAGPRHRVVGVIQDITERRRTDEMRTRLASIVASSDDAIISRGVDGIIRTWNGGAEKLTSYTAEEAIGQPIAMLYAPSEKVDHVVRKDGTRVEVSLTSSVLRNDEGEVIGASIIARDTSERRRTEAALQRVQDQLRQAQKMEAIGNLAGGVAHDFNNLLTVILSYTEMLMEDLQPSDPLCQDLEQVHQAGQRATEVTRQLLAFSRKQILQPVVLDVNESLLGVRKMLGRLLGEDIELSLLTSPRAGKVHADSGQIEQVVMNLVVNARDAMPLGGHLTIETSNVVLDAEYATEHPGVAPGPYVRIVVTDTGIGMDQATQARIFEPFFTTKDKSKGTGLGLSTVYGIVQQTGGHVSVRSELGRGTTFEVCLPRTDLPVDEMAPPGDDPGSLRGYETVLLVEDDAPVRSIMQAILRKSGYNVLDVENGGEAFLASEQFPARIDLLLTDVVMPRMSGRQLAERLGLQRPELKVLFVSGYTEDTIVHHGVLDAGIAFLAKPVTPDALLRKVRQVLDGRMRQTVAPYDRRQDSQRGSSTKSSGGSGSSSGSDTT